MVAGGHAMTGRRARLPDLTRQTMSVLVVAGVAGLALAGGCGFHEAICASGEYPVAAVGSTGRACVTNGQEPPAGYVRFPSGKVPKYVDDQWDRYWDEHVLDENGRETAR
jgi:hypothetical protein